MAKCPKCSSREHMTLTPTGETRLVANAPTAASLAGMMPKTTATEQNVYLLACDRDACDFSVEGYIDATHFTAFEQPAA